MRLPFLRSKDPASERRPRAALADDAADVEAERTRARRRLIGAGVLLLAGVIGFPLLFDTQPRPLPVDIPIELRSRELAVAPAPTPVPAPRPSAPPALPPDVGSEAAAAATPAPPGAVRAGESGGPAETPGTVSMPALAASTPAAPPARPAATAVDRSAVAATPAPAVPSAASPPVAPARRPDDGARARALLEGGASAPVASPAAPAPASRFVVQIGAFSDATALRQARQRVEKLGLQTYTQVVDTEAGKRTRVRVGPYASRAEADAAAARLKGAGLPAAILAL